MMQLLTYAHCPFCVRAKMIFGLRDIPYTETIIANDDDQSTTRLIGKKAVPVLIKEDGTAMGESLDIVRYIDEYAGKTRLDDHVRPELQAWLDKVGQYTARLISPRCVQPALPEFATLSARQYFIDKKTQSIGDFAANLAATDTYLAELTKDLPTLEALIHNPEHLGECLGYEDILTFPLLRNLTIVKGLRYPDKIQAYTETMAAAAKIDLFTDLAV